MTYATLLVDVEGPVATITLHRPERRNALSLEALRELLAAVTEVGDTNATGLILAAEGPVFSAGHDFADLRGADLTAATELVSTCTATMLALRRVPQVTIARVHALATAAGCQLVAACDLAVAAEGAGFALPGGKGGWFCTTPAVEVGRAIGTKRLAELAFTGDPIDAATALEWGLVNRVVPADELDVAVADLLGRATRGSRSSKAIGKAAMYRQLDLPLDEAYAYATTVMAEASQTPDAQEGITAFLDKRHPVWET
jgi:enoyl-CoA hydratase/carnithine racemase